MNDPAVAEPEDPDLVNPLEAAPGRGLPEPGAFVELRKAKIVAGHEEDLRQLVRRYEQFAENTLDTQQRVAADVAELRSRTASIEQILRTVE